MLHSSILKKGSFLGSWWMSYIIAAALKEVSALVLGCGKVSYLFFLTLAFLLKMGNLWHKRAVRERGGYISVTSENRLAKGAFKWAWEILCTCCHARCQKDILAPWWLLLARSHPDHGFFKFQFVIANPTCSSSLTVSFSFPPASLFSSCSPVIPAAGPVVQGGN